MTARVETYVGAGGKTTSIFPGPDGTEIGKKVAIVTTTHMMRPASWFISSDLPDGWRDVWQRDGIIVVGTLLDNGKITYPATPFMSPFATWLTWSWLKGTARGACP